MLTGYREVLFKYTQFIANTFGYNLYNIFRKEIIIFYVVDRGRFVLIHIFFLSIYQL